ncbi:MAG: hypothetical protein OXC44_06010 [Proteobacteria bacterium]|nr:hypothetical protein [Pseudomonadota bacterium]
MSSICNNKGDYVVVAHSLRRMRSHVCNACAGFRVFFLLPCFCLYRVSHFLFRGSHRALYLTYDVI